MSKWPKQLSVLTEEEKKIHDDFMKYWHELLPKQYGIMDKFNHGYPIQKSTNKGNVLEIGSGLGEHIAYEDLRETNYYAVEFRPDMAEVIKKRFDTVNVIVADCQKELPFANEYFDKVLAIHVLEHLPNLPEALKEIKRVIKKDGEFCVVIPCEGGFAHTFARTISAKRIFEKRYGISFNKFHKREHINTAKEVLEELNLNFKIEKKTFFPLLAPIIELNLAIGMILKKKSYSQ